MKIICLISAIAVFFSSCALSFTVSPRKIRPYTRNSQGLTRPKNAGCQPFCYYRRGVLHLLDDEDSDLTPAGEMKVSEIKAELEMRGIGFADCFEKQELVNRLEKARSEGKADPSILNDFNKRMMEKNLQEEKDLDEEELSRAMDDITANDGTLPGGLTPEAVRKLTSNPEIMTLLQNPKLQDAMKKVMTEGPSAMASYASDPEMMEMLTKLSTVMNDIAK